MSSSGQDSTGKANRSLVAVSTAVLLASSTWFSGTAATPSLKEAWQLTSLEGAWLTVSVQLGFIIGTFLYAFFNLADVFNARLVFFVSALSGAIFNAAFALLAEGVEGALIFRAFTGLTLAGIYPVGMKLVASWFREGLGWRLGVMVGALTMGTAFPYLIQSVGYELEWRVLVLAASVLAVGGGALVMLAVSDGPYLRSRATFDGHMLWRVFKYPSFRSTALAYFGHMWELYAFWSMVIFYLGARFHEDEAAPRGLLSLLVFFTIGAGSLGCIVGGWISRRFGEKAVAGFSLLASGVLCLFSGIIYQLDLRIVIAILLVWGFFVVADSPQFSALAARYCPAEYTATALTVQNGVGFAVTVISIQITPWMAEIAGWRWAFTFLCLGPFVGWCFLQRLPSDSSS